MIVPRAGQQLDPGAPGTTACCAPSWAARRRVSLVRGHPAAGRTDDGSCWRCVMQVLYPCCCGLDIHKKFVVACVLTTADDGRVQKATRTFSTMTDDLLALLDWLGGLGLTPRRLER